MVEDALEDIVEIDVVGEADVAVAVRTLGRKPLGLLLYALQDRRAAGVHRDRSVGGDGLLRIETRLDQRRDGLFDLL